MTFNERSIAIGDRPAASGRTAAPSQLSAEEAEISQLPWMIRLAITCLAATIFGWVVSIELLGLPSLVPWIFYTIAYAAGGYYSIQAAWQTLKQRQFDVNFL